MPTADIPDWTQLIDLVESLTPGQDFPDWTVGVQAPASSPIGGPFTAVGETVDTFIVQTNATLVGAWSVQPPLGTNPVVFLSNNSASVNDFYEVHFPAAAGTYQLFEIIWVAPDQGIQTISVDGTTVGTKDCYNASSSWNGASINDIVLSASGDHTVRVTMASKNGASTGFNNRIERLIMSRTA